MSTQQPQNVSYGLSQPLLVNAPSPVIAKRAPLTSDHLAIGTVWSNITTSTVYILASITNNLANWAIVSEGGVGAFTTLTVTPGPISLTGTTSINTTGTATTNIGTGNGANINMGNATGLTTIMGDFTVENGTIELNSTGIQETTIGVAPGTGVVRIGNATGNTFIDSGDLVVSTGDVTVVTAARGYVLPTGCIVLSGSGNPNGVTAFTAPIGSLYLNHTGSSTTDRLWINTNGGTVWTFFTSNA